MDFFDFQEKLSKRGGEPPQQDGIKPKRDVLTVSQLTAQIERTIKDKFPQAVLVKGEMSNFKVHGSSGHAYFTLKDPGACIDCVMYRSENERLRFTPEDGMEIVATGRLAVYAQRGRYQLIATRLEPVGEGALELARRKLIARLEREGLLATERKKALPPYPRRIALVTSTNTAALHDMLKVLRRFSCLRLMVYHVPVQGEGAAMQIAEALRDLSAGATSIGIDLIILARGGGSLEDMWQFNEEVVARAIAASIIPVITGIGHEIDVSVADLVADYHAHTPTEAAQVATAQWKNAAELMEQMRSRLRRELRNRLQQARQRLAHVERHEVFRRPRDRINQLRQQLDDRQQSLARVISARLARQRERMMRLLARLSERHPRQRLALVRERVLTRQRNLAAATRRVLEQRRQRLAGMLAHLNAIGPEQVLRRGYTITMLKKKGTVVKSAEQVKTGEKLVTRFVDGTVESTAEDKRQMGLFDNL